MRKLWLIERGDWVLAVRLLVIWPAVSLCIWAGLILGVRAVV